MSWNRKTKNEQVSSPNILLKNLIKVGEENFRVNFYKDLDGLGFEESFKKHFGMGSDQLISEFDEWIKQPVDELLKIIP